MQDNTQAQAANEVATDDTVEGFNLKREGGKAIYLNVFDGSLCRKSKNFVDGWEEKPIKTTNPQTKEDVFTFVERYDSIVARIVDVNKYQHKFENGGKVSGFDIALLAGGKRAILQLTWIEHTLKRFLKVAPNIDFEKPIRISVFATTKNGKKNTAVSFKQGDGPDPEQWDKVNEFYNNDNEEMPKGIHDDNDDSWDYKPQNKFLGEKFAADTLPKIKVIAARYPQPGRTEAQAAQVKSQMEAQPSGMGQPETKGNLAEAKANYQKQQQENPAQQTFPQTVAPIRDATERPAPVEPEGLMDRGTEYQTPPDDDIPF